MNEDFLCNTGYSLSVLSTALAMLISNQYDVDDLTTISCFLTALADLIALNADIKSRCTPDQTSEVNPPLHEQSGIDEQLLN